MDINIESQLVVKTSAQWAVNVTVYSELRILITSDVYYAGTDQRKFKIANGTDTWANLDYMPIGSGSGVQSVTGPQVDDTDPNNPIVNPLGLIQIIDLNGDFFTDLATATIYIEQFFSNPTIITDKSFNDHIFFFTVPNLTVMDLADGFLNNSTASFIDSFGLISEFQGGSVFYQNNAKHIFKDIFFNVVEAFTKAELNVECQDFNMDGGCAFASYTSGTFKIKGDIDPASASSGFFSASTATILASAKLYTSNSGVIDASLEQAILNGCNVQFEGINLVQSVTGDGVDNTDPLNPVLTFPTPNEIGAEPLKGADDNYVTDAQLTVIQNTSGTNTGDQDLSGLQVTSAKDATGGYVGLTLFKINFKNVLNTFTSFFTNSNTAARTYTFPDKDGTVAMTSDALSYQPIFSGKYRTQPYVGTVGTSGGFNGLIYFMPYFTGKPHTIISISMNCTSSVAGTSIRLAIYNQTNGVPTTLIEESGTINCSTSGMKIFTFSSPIALTNEVYFFAIQSSATTVALSYLVTANTSLILMRPNATELNSYSKTQAYGAFPNPVVTPGSSSSQPIIYAITQ